jgi:peptidoglycan/xylan/chitin deacetylase (PgdA/CDA1 family)
MQDSPYFKYRNGKAKIRLGLTIFGIIMVLMSSSVYAGFSIITLDLNNQKKYTIAGISVERFLQENGFILQRGDLIDIEGKLLKKGDGGLPTVFINKKSFLSNAKLKSQDRIVFISAKNIQEKIIKKRLPVAYSTIHDGKGPFITILQGKDGVQEVSEGTLSHKLVAKKILTQPVPRVYKRSLFSGNSKVVALTFDDGPGKYTWEILKILTEEKIPATFFVIGQQVKKWPAMMRLIVRYKYAIGNHSYTHKNLSELKFAQAKEEIEKTNLEIQNAGGKALWARPPGGRFNDNFLEIYNYLGMKTALWTIDTRDWTKPGPATIANRVIGSVHPGAVILLHDGGGNRRQTVMSLKIIIKELFKRGYGFVNLSQLTK